MNRSGTDEMTKCGASFISKRFRHGDPSLEKDPAGRVSTLICRSVQPEIITGIQVVRELI